MKTQQQIEQQLFKQQIIKDFDSTSLLYKETLSDYLSQEIELPELVTYVRYCINRLTILNKAVENSGIFQEDFINKFNQDCSDLLSELATMKGTSTTMLDKSSVVTCNALLNCFKDKYSKFVTNKNLFEISFNN